MHEPYWYPLYARAQELGIPLIVHGTNALDPRYRVVPHNYQLGFLTEQYLAGPVMTCTSWRRRSSSAGCRYGVSGVTTALHVCRGNGPAGAADVLARIDEAAKFNPLPELALSTQCGFASIHVANPVTPAAQRARLEMVVRLARRTWPDELPGNTSRDLNLTSPLLFIPDRSSFRATSLHFGTSAVIVGPLV